ncbi:hypothetical protein HY500_02370 [Candidatus Woesearchaeota archaeon]|nr:hypothetical protein [Candidatus Woesearchaeota archaeon]
MKSMRYILAVLTAASHALATPEVIGNQFRLFNQEGVRFVAEDISRVLATRYNGSPAKISEELQSYLLGSLAQLKPTKSPLETVLWQFSIEGQSGSSDSLNVGLNAAIQDSTVLTTKARLGIHPDTTLVERTTTDTIKETRYAEKPETSPLSITGVRFGLSYGIVSPEIGLVIGNRLVVSGSPYNLPSSRNPEAVTTYTSQDPVLGTRYETSADTNRVATRIKSLSMGVLIPIKDLELTVGGGIHWEEKEVRGYAKTQKVDRNDVPLIHAQAREGPFNSRKSSRNPMGNLGLDYKIKEKNAMGFYYQRVLGNNGKNGAGVNYRRTF